jgi:hypothetical protein
MAFLLIDRPIFAPNQMYFPDRRLPPPAVAIISYWPHFALKDTKPPFPGKPANINIRIVHATAIRPVWLIFLLKY